MQADVAEELGFCICVGFATPSGMRRIPRTLQSREGSQDSVSKPFFRYCFCLKLCLFFCFAPSRTNCRYSTWSVTAVPGFGFPARNQYAPFPPQPKTLEKRPQNDPIGPKNTKIRKIGKIHKIRKIGRFRPWAPYLCVMAESPRLTAREGAGVLKPGLTPGRRTAPTILSRMRMRVV